jgi:hypothetical protein
MILIQDRILTKLPGTKKSPESGQLFRYQTRNLLDLAHRFKASSAEFLLDFCSVLDGRNIMQVWIKQPVSFSMGVRNVVPSYRPFATHITFTRHFINLTFPDLDNNKTCIIIGMLLKIK